MSTPQPPTPTDQALVETTPDWERAPTELDVFASDHDEKASRDIVTQHAYRIAPSLLGLPLATPRQRAFAMAVDGTLVLMLTKTGGVLLAALAAVFVYSWLRSRNKSQNKLRRGLSMSAYVMLALLIFSLAVSWLQPLWERYVDEDDEPDRTEEQAPKSNAGKASEGLTLTGAEGIALGLATAALHMCDEASCRKEIVEGYAAKLSKADAKPEAKLRALDSLIDGATEDAAERTTLKNGARAQIEQPTIEVDTSAEESLAALAGSVDHESKEQEYSVIKQLAGLLDDLGLSLGWAAAYFTLFTTLWSGRTPGKRLMGIRVVELSGKPMSYWTSFERYGGYAAGFTTGLFGFLQVYWKPNRQAIQDQLTFTAVIRDGGKSAPSTEVRQP